MGIIKWKSLAEQTKEDDLIQLSQTNKKTLEEQAIIALEKNRTFIALTSPTNAQTVAQVKAMARQNNAIIRLLLLGKLEGTD